MFHSIILFRKRHVSYANYLGMLGVVIAIDAGMIAFLLSHVYPPDDQQFLNGAAPKTMALLTGNGSYAPITEPVRVASYVDLVMAVGLVT